MMQPFVHDALKRVLESEDFKMLKDQDPDGEEMWEDPAGHVMTFDGAVLQVYGKCERCSQPCCYPGAKFCGAGCSARSEVKTHSSTLNQQDPTR